MKHFNSLILSTFLLIISGSISAQSFNGYALYNALNNNTTYLIDQDANIAHSWNCDKTGSYAVLLKDNGNIVRTAVNTSNQLNGAAVSGLIQELDKDANVVWEFEYSDASHVSHHDITLMPNGNVMLIAWEVKTTAELTQAGYNGATANKWPDHFVEVQQNGTGGQIVWEWHIWDHMIQDFDNTKDNFGVVADHPELMDINAIAATGGGPGPGGSSGDWYHCNGIDYNPTLDQIVFTSRHASELFIIDHSTTTAEAASHSGGNSGKGGDFLFRWGNPANYGANATQNIPAAVHDPRWVKEGRPKAGYIQFFNNEGGSTNGSTVDAINPPVTGYTYAAPDSPSSYDLRHNCLVNSTGQSASDRMSDGNVFVNVSQQYMYEVDTLGNTVWQYSAGTAKAFRYECDHDGIKALFAATATSTDATTTGGSDGSINVALNLEQNNLNYAWSNGANTQNLSNVVAGDYTLTVTANSGAGCAVTTTATVSEPVSAINELTSDKVSLFPNPSNGIVNIKGIPVAATYFEINVFDLYGKLVSRVNNNTEVDLSNLMNGMYVLHITVDEKQSIVKRVSLLN